MVHWLDGMIYVEEDRILVSNGGSGQHMATSQQFEGEVPGGIPDDARVYYANMLMPFSMLIARKKLLAGQIKKDAGGI